MSRSVIDTSAYSHFQRGDPQVVELIDSAGWLGAGTPVPSNDIWIAAAASRRGVSVLTYDKHFGLIQRTGSVILKPSVK